MLIIAEFSFKSVQSYANWPHLNPEKAAQIASEAKRMALLHFDADIYKKFQNRKEADEKVRKIFINSFAAIHDQEIII